MENNYIFLNNPKINDSMLHGARLILLVRCTFQGDEEVLLFYTKNIHELATVSEYVA